MDSAFFPHEFPKLQNLKQLELAIGLACGYPLFCYISLIKASPSLLRFALKVLLLLLARSLKFFLGNTNSITIISTLQRLI